MMKKISAIVLALAVSVVLAFGCLAADPTGTVVYNGSELKVNGQMQGFDQLVPGVPKTGSIQLKNDTSNKTVNFYMSTQVVENLINAAQGSKDGAFSIKLTCGDKVLYGYDAASNTATGALVGGKDTEGLKELDKSLQGELLVATLDAGKTADVVLTITPDPLVNDTYQLSEGLIQFQFTANELTPQVENKTERKSGEDTIITQTRYLVEAARTGDTNLIFVAGGVLVLALAVFFLTKKKKKEDQ